ncbi:TetR/AcrR family transcriptional regulator [Actinoallomurus rhizosphaericola]|uniref:TetR/AcrR family transcriptional regulator n=1 Tax=Actinoallomurus rhizosphaericola TaxID=2952536 RepID=UPI0020903B46|nr:TetR family transcriptional regulator [Actinoallomurus rhizosphaericola]MCO5994447.1 TetR family transcriptional regulator [Actinoallomurus rhizosphaericola]
MTTPTRRPGRRPGPSSSRDDILAAARVLFGERGYDKASIRAIAREAGVDPALVHHFFGSKEELFAAAMEFPVDPAVFLGQVMAGPRSQIGERMARTFLRIWSDPRLRPQFVGIFRSAATTEQGAALLREFVTRAILARVADALALPPLNLAAAAAQMMGVVMLKYIVQVEPVASATEDELVALLAPTLQRYLEG